MTHTRRIAEKAQALSFDALPGEVVARAKEAILDTIGVTLAGASSESADILNDHIELLGGRPEATVLARGRKNSPVNAALVNAAMGHVLDYDDVSWSSIGHPAVVTLFPALALGETRDVSGKELIAAFVAGYVAMACVGRGVVPEYNARGWHSTATIGCFGAAAAARRVLGLTVDGATAALGMAGSLAAGVKGNMGTMTKHLQVGRAASSGVTAALLAGKGFTASSGVLEGKDGFCSVFAPRYDLDRMVESFGRPFDLVSGGAIFKKWPSCYSTHTCIEAVTGLAEEHDIRPEQVETIEIGATPLVVDVLFYSEPVTGFQAKFSDQFCAAVSVARRRATVAEFSDEVVADPVIRDLMRKVRLAVDPELSRSGYALPSDEGPTRTRVAVTLRDGRVLRREVAIAKGAPQRRLTEQEVAGKYMSCAAPVLGEDGARRSMEMIAGLEKMARIRPLADLVAGGAAGRRG